VGDKKEGDKGMEGIKGRKIWDNISVDLFQ
jgi:hypothetical protein